MTLCDVCGGECKLEAQRQRADDWRASLRTANREAGVYLRMLAAHNAASVVGGSTCKGQLQP